MTSYPRRAANARQTAPMTLTDCCGGRRRLVLLHVQGLIDAMRARTMCASFFFGWSRQGSCPAKATCSVFAVYTLDCVICCQMPSLARAVVVCLYVVKAALAQSPAAGLTREQLQPLTQFRQQHRRTIDGRLCAAAFVQNRKAFTDCTAAANPAGESGRPWCYVESQVGQEGFACFNARMFLCR